jgi:hypothetical protein
MIRLYKILSLVVILSSCERSDEVNYPLLKIYGDALEDIGYSVSISDNGYYIGGQFTEFSRLNGNYIEAESASKKMAVIKTNADGNVIWKKSFGGRLVAVGSKVVALDDGSVVSTGYVIDSVTKEKDIYVVKISSDGESTIEKIFNSSGTSVQGNTADGNQSGIDIIQSSDGFLLMGSTDVARLQSGDSVGNIKGNSDIYLLKLNTNLEAVGVPVIIGFPGNDLGVAIKPVVNGGYIIAGSTNNSEQGQGQALSNILLIKTTASGSVTGKRILGTTDDEYATDIEVLADGYMIAGYVGAEGADQQVYITKVPLNISDQQIFSRKYKPVMANSTATSFAVKAISKYRNSSFVMAGQAGTGASAKMLLFIADSDGNQIAGKGIVTVASGSQIAFDVITDENDNIIAVGKDSFENNSMIIFYKVKF